MAFLLRTLAFFLTGAYAGGPIGWYTADPLRWNGRRPGGHLRHTRRDLRQLLANLWFGASPEQPHLKAMFAIATVAHTTGEPVGLDEWKLPAKRHCVL